MFFFSAVEKNEKFKSTGKWMDLEIFMLNEFSIDPERQMHVFSHMILALTL